MLWLVSIRLNKCSPSTITIQYHSSICSLTSTYWSQGSRRILEYKNDVNYYTMTYVTRSYPKEDKDQWPSYLNSFINWLKWKDNRIGCLLLSFPLQSRSWPTSGCMKTKFENGTILHDWHPQRTESMNVSSNSPRVLEKVTWRHLLVVSKKTSPQR